MEFEFIISPQENSAIARHFLFQGNNEWGLDTIPLCDRFKIYQTKRSGGKV